MPITFELQESRDVLQILFSGDVTSSEMVTYIREWERKPKLDRQVVAYADLSEVTAFDVDSGLLMGHGQTMSQRYQMEGDLLAAVILAPDDLTFGYARMFQMFSGDDFPVFLFRDREGADTRTNEILLAHAEGEAAEE